MKLKTTIITTLMLILPFSVNSLECRKYTSDQREIIDKAYAYGKLYGYEETLAAIVIRESFVGERIIRYNPTDPSTGITHIFFPTLKHLSGLNHWDAMIEAERLITDDVLSFEYSIKKLNSVRSKTLWGKWKGYNGSSEYANHIQGIISQFKICKTFQGWD